MDINETYKQAVNGIIERITSNTANETDILIYGLMCHMKKMAEDMLCQVKTTKDGFEGFRQYLNDSKNRMEKLEEISNKQLEWCMTKCK